MHRTLSYHLDQLHSLNSTWSRLKVCIRRFHAILTSYITCGTGSRYKVYIESFLTILTSNIACCTGSWFKSRVKGFLTI
uniref:Uncharacterized protein n=1 Tax=Helianthus annuus TaxID=4232 RepID=A0A251V2Y2_HELAN